MITETSSNLGLRSKLYALVTCLIWSTSPAFLRNAMASFEPLPLSLLRLMIASATLVIMGCIQRIGLPKLRDVPYFLVTGFAGFGGYYYVYNTGTELLGSGLNAIILATSPVMVAMMASVLFKEKLSHRHWIAVGVEFFGLLILVIFDGLLHFNIGVLLLFGAAVLMSVYNLMQRQSAHTYTSLQFVTYSMIPGTLMQIWLLPDMVEQVRHAEPMHLVLVTFTAVFATAIAYFLWGKALEWADKTSDVTNFMFLNPFLATLIGWMLNGEIPTIATLVGGTVVLFGVGLFNFWCGDHHPAPKSK